jgi:hypothetical protein
MRGKLDATRNPAKLLCDEATTDFQLFEAAEDDRNRDWLPDDLPPYEEAARVEYSQAHSGFDPVLSEEPPSAFDDTYLTHPPSAPRRADETIATAGPAASAAPEQDALPPHRNGKQRPLASNVRDSAEDTHPELSYPTAAPRSRAASARKGPARHLIIGFYRSGDQEWDKRKLQKVHGIVYQFPGEDAFSFRLIGQGPTMDIDFEAGINYDEAIDALSAMCANGDIKIIDT